MADNGGAAMAIETGGRLPEFSLPGDDGKSYAPADFAGRKLVLYFYPKDDTSGCTLEAQGFTERAGDFAAAGAVVVGVSKDSVKSHCKFRDKHGLGVLLLSDETGELVEGLGFWGEKSMYGRKYMGIERATLLVDRDGAVARVWRNVKVPGHVDEVLAAAQAL
jgi:thioredoxin-dependent peroxiredoxin